MNFVGVARIPIESITEHINYISNDPMQDGTISTSSSERPVDFNYLLRLLELIFKHWPFDIWIDPAMNERIRNFVNILCDERTTNSVAQSISSMGLTNNMLNQPSNSVFVALVLCQAFEMYLWFQHWISRGFYMRSEWVTAANQFSLEDDN